MTLIGNKDSISNVILWQISLFQPLTSCRLTQGCGAELTTHCAVSKASGGSSHDPAFESRCVFRFRLNHQHQQTQSKKMSTSVCSGNMSVLTGQQGRMVTTTSSMSCQELQ